MLTIMKVSECVGKHKKYLSREITTFTVTVYIYLYGNLQIYSLDVFGIEPMETI